MIRKVSAAARVMSQGLDAVWSFGPGAGEFPSLC